MIVLALDGALGGFSAALDRDGSVSADRSAGNDALETGLARIGALLSAGGLTLRDVDRLAVGVGPGSFTGIRIAISFAKALAYGAGIPLVGVSSYDALTPGDAPQPVLTVVRGRAGVICARLSGAAGARVACGATAAVLNELLAGFSPGDAIAVTGATEDVLPDIGERGIIVRAIPPRAPIPAVAIAALARDRAPSDSPHALAPDYGEIPAVTPPKARR